MICNPAYTYKYQLKTTQVVIYCGQRVQFWTLIWKKITGRVKCILVTYVESVSREKYLWIVISKLNMKVCKYLVFIQQANLLKSNIFDHRSTFLLRENHFNLWIQLLKCQKKYQNLIFKIIQSSISKIIQIFQLFFSIKK